MVYFKDPTRSACIAVSRNVRSFEIEPSEDSVGFLRVSFLEGVCGVCVWRRSGDTRSRTFWRTSRYGRGGFFCFFSKKPHFSPCFVLLPVRIFDFTFAFGKITCGFLIAYPAPNRLLPHAVRTLTLSFAFGKPPSVSSSRLPVVTAI
jgi:hypothetical protein